MLSRAKQVLQLRRPNIIARPRPERVPITGGSLLIWREWKDSGFVIDWAAYLYKLSS